MAADRKSESGRRVRKSIETANQADVQKRESTKRRERVSARTFGRLFRPLAPAFGFLAKILRRITPRYFINSWREVRLVSWPNRVETWRLTLAVFVFAIIFGTLVALVDHGLDEIFKKVVLR